MMLNVSIAQFIGHLARIEAEVAALSPAIVQRACAMIQAEAKAVIGRGYANWPPLAASTIADKAQHGFKTPAPLLRTGEMRDSIEITIASDGMSGEIGSNSDKAVWQEMGTVHIPPRSFLGQAGMVTGPKIAKVAQRGLADICEGRHLSPELRMIVRAVEHLAHTVKDAAQELLEDDDK